MTIFTHQQGKIVFVEDAPSHEEAVARFLSRLRKIPKGGVTINQCPDCLVSIAEVRNLIYGIRDRT
jgi:uncharacterized protein with PIN domain